jgi:uncharacterized membrane protein YedE/YeeE
MELAIGLVTGIAFGFLLQKGEVLRFERQVGFMLLKDMTIIKFMLTAVLVGMIGIYAFVDTGLINLSVKPTNLAAIAVGGLLFGVGWALAGYCPGTSLGALAEGRIHAIWAIFGMLAGAAIYAEAYPVMKQTLLTWGQYGKITLPQVFGVSPWFLAPIFITFGVALLFWFERRGL